MDKSDILIIGSGPTGIGAGYNLNARKARGWKIVEKSNVLGGLAGSETDSNGFTWDTAGHVLFSRHEKFNKILEETASNDVKKLERRSYIRYGKHWVPYPFQNNIHYLPLVAKLECLAGLLFTNPQPPSTYKSFLEWIYSSFGSGIAKHFLVPYNKKVWAHPLEDMGTYWMGDRVSVVDFKRILVNTILNRDDVGWGPNAIFYYPKRGGFAGLFEQWAHPFKNDILFQQEVETIDVDRNEVTYVSGEKEQYRHLVSTMPLDILISKIPQAPFELKDATKHLIYHGIIGVGVGFEKELDLDLCWGYAPDPDVPFYRVTQLSKYSNHVVPGGDTKKFSAFLCEAPYSDYLPLDKENVIENCIQGLIKTGLIDDSDRAKIVTRYSIDCPYAYPVPSINRNKGIRAIMPWLESKNIFSRGRFGTWMYEIGNSDHAFMMGFEVVDRILDKKKEITYQLPTA